MPPETPSRPGASADAPLPSHVRVAVIGAGFGGIATAVRLLQEGERDFVLLERARTVGGTWRDNSYPGCACDVQSSHLGVTVAGFPNLFMLMGPNTGLGHTSVVLMIEAQVEHVVGALRHLRAHGAAAVEPSAEAQRAWLAEVDERMRGTVWVAGGCASWYLDATGRNSALRPDSTRRYRRRVVRFDAAAYLPTPREAESREAQTREAESREPAAMERGA